MTRLNEDNRPMPSMHEKLVSLAHCIAREWWEDAAGHLCDLLEHCRTKIRPSSGKPISSLKKMVEHYGGNPIDIDEDTT